MSSDWNRVNLCVWGGLGGDRPTAPGSDDPDKEQLRSDSHVWHVTRGYQSLFISTQEINKFIM